MGHVACPREEGHNPFQSTYTEGKVSHTGAESIDGKDQDVADQSRCRKPSDVAVGEIGASGVTIGDLGVSISSHE